jgi:hypothetical protein
MYPSLEDPRKHRYGIRCGKRRCTQTHVHVKPKQYRAAGPTATAVQDQVQEGVLEEPHAPAPAPHDVEAGEEELCFEDWLAPAAGTESGTESETDVPAAEGAPAPSQMDAVVLQHATSYASSVFFNKLQHQHRCQAEQQALQTMATHGLCVCTKCGTAAEHGQLSSCEPWDVYMGTQLALHSISVPKRECSSCSTPFYPTPVQLDCIAGSPNAYEPRRPAKRPLLFTQQLMQHLDLTLHNVKGASVFGYVKALVGMWQGSAHALQLEPAQPGSTAPAALPYVPDTIARVLPTQHTWAGRAT